MSPDPLKGPADPDAELKQHPIVPNKGRHTESMPPGEIEIEEIEIIEVDEVDEPEK